MNYKIVLATSAALLFGSSLVFAAGGKVTILSPANGATVKASENVKLTYEADVGPEGDHLHLNVDGKRVDVIHQLKGSTDLWLYEGKHHVCMAVNTKAHVPTGTEACIDVIAVK
jgi:hypothetical protein